MVEEKVKLLGPRVCCQWDQGLRCRMASWLRCSRTLDRRKPHEFSIEGWTRMMRPVQPWRQSFLALLELVNFQLKIYEEMLAKDEVWSTVMVRPCWRRQMAGLAMIVTVLEL